MSLDRHIEKAVPGLAVSASSPDRIAYARDLWPRHHLAVVAGHIADHRPGAVVWPESTAEVQSVVRFCAEEGIPLVPYGAGSGVCAGVLPHEQMVVLDLKRMKRWRKLDHEQPSLTVESGAMGIRLEEDLQTAGYTAGHFPSSILCSTVGGWIAGRGAGQCSGLYGKIEDMVTSLECVIGRGEVVTFSRRTHGPDMTPLLIGSEGVLGVITAATLRLHPAPPARTFGAFSFPTVEAGFEAMRLMFQAGLRPAVCRLYDAFDSFMARMGSVSKGKSRVARRKKHRDRVGAGTLAMRSALRVPGLLNRIVDAVGERRLGGAKLVLVFEGPADEGREGLARCREIATKLEARDLGEGPARHWLEHRYSVSYRQAPMFMAGAFSDTMEVAAPWSRLADLYHGVRAALGKHVFVMAHLSHAYPDGCSIYFTFAASAPTRDESEARYDEAWRAGLDAAIASGGTLSHHHGVGRSKAPKLGAELGLGVDVVHALRRTFDPTEIMNPGNLMPRSAPAHRPAAAPPGEPTLDRTSMLVHAAGDEKLAAVEAAAKSAGWTLGLGPDAPPLGEVTVAKWIAGGARGAQDPYDDPVDHLAAGFTAKLRTGADLEVRVAPRRAVGPDLMALFLGTEEKVGTITSAHLRVHGPARARPLTCSVERNPPVDADEARWIDALLASAASVK